MLASAKTSPRPQRRSRAHRRAGGSKGARRAKLLCQRRSLCAALVSRCETGDNSAALCRTTPGSTVDTYGRREGFVRFQATAPTTLAAGTSAATDANFTVQRSESTLFNHRGRVVQEISPEGTLSYGYDVQGRMTFTAINAAPLALDVANGSGSYLSADPTTADRVTYNGYDILGRLVTVTEDATPSNITDDSQVATDYDFDLQGRMRAMATGTTHAMPSVLTVMEYDRLGRLDVMTDTDVDGNTLASYDYEVRADGKRTSSSETFWVDANEDGIQTPDELRTSSYTWSYDNANRLTDEAIDHWDDTFDRAESFEYDLTGNRTALNRDKGNNGTVDESVEYRYDANDRMFAELTDDLTATDADTTTIYGYDHTQQTAKTVYADLLDDATIDALVDGGDDSTQQRVSSQSFTYNLQGRMSEAVVDKYNTDGTLDTRERSSYEYDMRSFRVGQLVEDYDTNNDTWSLKSDTSFLVSHRNHTGYAQTLRETTTNADGSTKTIDYTFGSDETAQRVVERDDQGNVTSDQTLAYGHDGHGSVRVLYDIAATAGNLIDQIATYSAYGVMIAMHSGNGTTSPVTEFKSTLTYSGEAWDRVIGRSNNRERWYDPFNGTWNRSDPFAGNMQDPQSLHKYAYVHGDPIGSIDPSGKSSFSLGGALTGMAVMGTAGALVGASIGAVNGTIGVLRGQMSAREAFAQVGYGALYGGVLGSIAGFIMGGFIVGLAATPVLALNAGVNTAIYVIGGMLAARYAPAIVASGGDLRALDDQLAYKSFPGVNWYNDGIPYKYAGLIEQTALANDLPPLLLLSVLMYEAYQYNEFDVAVEAVMLEGTTGGALGRFEERSLGIAQLRQDNIRKTFPGEYGSMSNPELRDLLFDPQSAIPILGKVLGHMRDTYTTPGDDLHVTFSSWFTMSEGDQEARVAAYAGAKDNYGPDGKPYYPWGAEHGASRLYGVEMGYRRWKGVPPMQWQ